SQLQSSQVLDSLRYLHQALDTQLRLTVTKDGKKRLTGTAVERALSTFSNASSSDTDFSQRGVWPSLSISLAAELTAEMWLVTTALVGVACCSGKSLGAKSKWADDRFLKSVCDSLERVMAQCVGFVEGWVALAQIKSFNEDWIGAQSVLEMALTMFRKPPAHVLHRLGYVLFRQKQTDKAVLHFQAAVERDSRFVEAMASLATVLRSLESLEPERAVTVKMAKEIYRRLHNLPQTSLPHDLYPVRRLLRLLTIVPTVDASPFLDRLSPYYDDLYMESDSQGANADLPIVHLRRATALCHLAARSRRKARAETRRILDKDKWDPVGGLLLGRCAVTYRDVAELRPGDGELNGYADVQAKPEDESWEGEVNDFEEGFAATEAVDVLGRVITLLQVLETCSVVVEVGVDGCRKRGREVDLVDELRDRGGGKKVKGAGGEGVAGDLMEVDGKDKDGGGNGDGKSKDDESALPPEVLGELKKNQGSKILFKDRARREAFMAEALCNRAMLLHKLGRNEKALENAYHAYQLFPNNNIIYFNYCNLLHRLGHHRTAFTTWMRSRTRGAWVSIRNQDNAFWGQVAQRLLEIHLAGASNNAGQKSAAAAESNKEQDRDIGKGKAVVAPSIGKDGVKGGVSPRKEVAKAYTLHRILGEVFQKCGGGKQRSNRMLFQRGGVDGLGAGGSSLGGVEAFFEPLLRGVMSMDGFCEVGSLTAVGLPLKGVLWMDLKAVRWFAEERG
ncbi:hypothetical protein HDU76_013787, partial [Blyttiomyces sp. JEL0837]